MITKELFDSLYTENITKKEYDRIIELINDRFSDIINLIIPSYDWFVYGNYREEVENCEGFFNIDEFKHNISVGGCIKFPEPYCFTGEGCGYFPTKWLWTDDSKILEEFNKNVEKYKKEKESKKLKAKEKREERKKLKAKMKNIISSKLTKEELKFVCFK